MYFITHTSLTFFFVKKMEKWRGKGALVTGANSGIGAAVTKKLLELGMVVAGLDRQVENLNVSIFFRFFLCVL